MSAESAIKWVLRFIGIMAIPALVVAVMAQSWFAYLIQKAELGMPVGILLTYLRRMLMALYAFAGLQCFAFAADISRYRPLIWLLGLGSLGVTLIGLVVPFFTAPSGNRGGLFWIVFGDFVEGFVQALLLVILLLRIRSSRWRTAQRLL